MLTYYNYYTYVFGVWGTTYCISGMVIITPPL